MVSPDGTLANCFSANVGETAAAIAESERLRGAIRAQHQGILLGAHDLLRRGLIAQRDSRIRLRIITASETIKVSATG